MKEGEELHRAADSCLQLVASAKHRNRLKHGNTPTCGAPGRVPQTRSHLWHARLTRCAASH